jgi:hypothetical protein
MYERLTTQITRAPGRRSLYHFTRTANLAMIAEQDSLLSSRLISGEESGERRTQLMPVALGQGIALLNTHLRIVPQMFAAGTTSEVFRAYLDRHVFFWPTLRDCRYMMASYARREPEESFTVLQFNALSILTRHAHLVKLSKYDSGSSPRYPERTSYHKSLAMFLPLGQFPGSAAMAQPERPGDIREVLIENRVEQLNSALVAVYTHNRAHVPANWLDRHQPYALLQA